MGFISELIGYPLGWIMWAVYALVKNYGVAILIFTFIVRLILFPLSVKQQKSTAAMAAFQPKLDKLKKQYANNPNKLQEEQMKLYAEENINPMASCLPMFLQLFFLYGVFDVVYRPLYHILRISKQGIEALKTVAAPMFEGVNYFNSRPELYILQAVKDNPAAFEGAEGVTPEMLEKISGFNNKLFGIIDLGAIPKTIFDEGTVWNAAAIGLLLIPIISGVIQLAMTIYSTAKQKKLNPEASAQMGSMNSLVGLIQMFVLNKIYTPEYVAKLVEKDKLKKKNQKKSGIMQKYNDMLQEQLKQQNGGTSNNGRMTSAPVVRDEETGEEIKLSKSQAKDYERRIIAEARRKQAEMYGDGSVSSDNDDE